MGWDRGDAREGNGFESRDLADSAKVIVIMPLVGKNTHIIYQLRLLDTSQIIAEDNQLNHSPKQELISSTLQFHQPVWHIIHAVFQST